MFSLLYHRNLYRLGLAIGLVTISFLATTDLSIPAVDSIWDKGKHFSAFLVLAWLSDFSFPERGYNLINILVLTAYGVLIELIQWGLPYREFSLLDLLADLLGCCLYLLVAVPLTPWRNRCRCATVGLS